MSGHKEVILSGPARIDLELIAQWSLAHWDEETATNYVRSIFDRLGQLESFPKLGQILSAAHPNILCLRMRQHKAI